MQEPQRAGMRDEGPDTKHRLLDAAEQLFARRGTAGTSLRAITAAAGANVAAVHYHFGSKESLLQAVVERRLAPANQDRLKRLEQLHATLDTRVPDVEAILDALLSPVILDPTRELRHVFALIATEPTETFGPVTRAVFGGVMDQFLPALEMALPQIAPDEVAERFHLSIGALLHVMSGRVDFHLGREPADGDASGLLRSMIAFLSAGLRAAPTRPVPARCTS